MNLKLKRTDSSLDLPQNKSLHQLYIKNMGLAFYVYQSNILCWNRAILVWPWKTVSKSVQKFFHLPVGFEFRTQNPAEDAL